MWYASIDCFFRLVDHNRTIWKTDFSLVEILRQDLRPKLAITVLPHQVPGIKNLKGIPPDFKTI